MSQTPLQKAVAIIGRAMLTLLEAAGLIVVDAAALRSLLDKVGKRSHCRGPSCGVEVWYVQHPGKPKPVPYTAAGLNHFIDCPDAPKFKRPAVHPEREP